MPIKPLSTPTVAAPVTKKSSTPVIEVDSNLVGEFVKADAAAKVAKAVLDEVKPLLTDIALKRYFALRASGSAAKSVKLKAKDGAVARFDFKDQYKSVDGAAVEALFETELGRDVNDYVQSSLKVGFNNDVFYDADGTFQEARFEKFKAACAEVAAALGVVNPLTVTPQVTAKPGFHAIRFAEFDAEENGKIAKVLGNTVALVAVSQPVNADAPTLAEATVADGEEV